MRVRARIPLMPNGGSLDLRLPFARAREGFQLHAVPFIV